MQKLQRQLEFLAVQEEYIKDEQRNLKKEFLHAQEEVKRIQSVPLVIGQFLEAVDQNTGIVGSTTGSNYYVRILSTIDRELLKPSASVALHKHSNALVDVLPPEADSSISMLQAGKLVMLLGLERTACAVAIPFQTKSLTFSIRTSEAWTCRSRRSGRLWNCR